jgi:hypothetical protein
MSKLAPGLPGAVVRTGNEIHVKDGRPELSVDITLPPETLEEYRAGYRCIACHAAQESAWPERCLEPYCRFPIKRDQARQLEIEFRGEESLWPTREDEDEDPDERRTSSGIYLP